MAGLRSRLTRLDRAFHSGPTRLVIISTVEGTNESAGSIEPFRNGRGYTMRVPAAFGADPVAGLDAHQRAFLQAGDEVLALTWEDHGDSLTVGEIRLRWPGDSPPGSL